jgi:hypothetical protein
MRHFLVQIISLCLSIFLKFIFYFQSFFNLVSFIRSQISFHFSAFIYFLFVQTSWLERSNKKLRKKCLISILTAFFIIYVTETMLGSIYEWRNANLVKVWGPPPLHDNVINLSSPIPFGNWHHLWILPNYLKMLPPMIFLKFTSYLFLQVKKTMSELLFKFNLNSISYLFGNSLKCFYLVGSQSSFQKSLSIQESNISINRQTTNPVINRFLSKYKDSPFQMAQL